jgi:hypothetical protein
MEQQPRLPSPTHHAVTSHTRNEPPAQIQNAVSCHWSIQMPHGWHHGRGSRQQRHYVSLSPAHGTARRACCLRLPGMPPDLVRAAQGGSSNPSTQRQPQHETYHAPNTLCPATPSAPPSRVSLQPPPPRGRAASFWPFGRAPTLPKASDVESDLRGHRTSDLDKRITPRCWKAGRQRPPPMLWHSEHRVRTTGEQREAGDSTRLEGPASGHR